MQFNRGFSSCILLKNEKNTHKHTKYLKRNQFDYHNLHLHRFRQTENENERKRMRKYQLQLDKMYIKNCSTFIPMVYLLWILCVIRANRSCILIITYTESYNLPVFSDSMK